MDEVEEDMASRNARETSAATEKEPLPPVAEPSGTMKQRDADDCTICCIAMATGLPYEAVMAVAATSRGGYRYQGTPGTMSPKGVLMDLGFSAERIPMGAVGEYMRKRVLFGRRAILSVPSLNGFDGHHDVYWDGRRICDPSHGKTYAPDGLAAVTPSWATVMDEVARERPSRMEPHQ